MPELQPFLARVNDVRDCGWRWHLEDTPLQGGARGYLVRLIRGRVKLRDVGSTPEEALERALQRAEERLSQGNDAQEEQGMLRPTK